MPDSNQGNLSASCLLVFSEKYEFLPFFRFFPQLLSNHATAKVANLFLWRRWLALIWKSECDFHRLIGQKRYILCFKLCFSEKEKWGCNWLLANMVSLEKTLLGFRGSCVCVSLRIWIGEWRLWHLCLVLPEKHQIKIKPNYSLFAILKGIKLLFAIWVCKLNI